MVGNAEIMMPRFEILVTAVAVNARPTRAKITCDPSPLAPRVPPCDLVYTRHLPCLMVPTGLTSAVAFGPVR